MLTHKDEMQKSPMKCVCKIKKIPNSDMEFGIFYSVVLRKLHFHQPVFRRNLILDNIF